MKLKELFKKRPLRYINTPKDRENIATEKPKPLPEDSVVTLLKDLKKDLDEVKEISETERMHLNSIIQELYKRLMVFTDWKRKYERS